MAQRSPAPPPRRPVDAGRPVPPVAKQSVPELLKARAAGGSLRRDISRDVKFKLRLLIVDLAAQGENRLPSEEQLSLDIGVSRTTLRSGLLELQKEGRIQRVHGRGTFINLHALSIDANLAEDRPFVDLLRAVGYEPSLTSEVQPVSLMAEPLCGLLDWEAPREVCTVARVFRASGDPAVFLLDHVPTELLRTAVEDLTGEESTFEFLRLHTGRQVRYSVAEVVPVTAGAEVAKRLELTPGHPLLLLLHTHLDDDDRPLAVTKAYVNDGYLKFSVVRTYRGA